MLEGLLQSERTWRKQKVLKSRYSTAHSVPWQCRIAHLNQQQQQKFGQVKCILRDMDLIYYFTIIYLEISVSIDIAPFEVHMSTVSGLLHG